MVKAPSDMALPLCGNWHKQPWLVIGWLAGTCRRRPGAVRSDGIEKQFSQQKTELRPVLKFPQMDQSADASPH